MTTADRYKIKNNTSRSRWVHGIFKWLILIIPFYSILLICSGVLFGSKGPILIAYIVSALIGFRSLRLRISRKPHILESNARITRWGPFVMSHSHHILEKDNQSHEIRVGNKYFCARCYGMIFGILFSLVIVTKYLMNSIDPQMHPLLPFSLPLIIFLLWSSFVMKHKLGAFVRSFSGFLLPILIWNILIVIDNTYKNWILNSLFLCLAFVGCNMIGFYILLFHRSLI